MRRVPHTSEAGSDVSSRVVYLICLIHLIAITCCSSQSRHQEKNDAGKDSGTDTDEDSGSDGGDTDLPWDASVDTDVVVVEPYFLLDSSGPMCMSYNGSHVAISWSDDKLDPFAEQYETVVLIFPWESPEDAMTSSFVEDPPACEPDYSGALPNSEPHPHPSGFLLLTAVSFWSADDCEVVQSLWDNEANSLDDLHSFSGLFSDEYILPMDPHGVSDDVGVVTTGTILGEGMGSPEELSDTDGTVYMEVDKWGNGGLHERFVHASYPWTVVPEGLESKYVQTSNVGNSICLHDDIFTLLAIEWTNYSGYSNISTNSVIARVGIDGDVVQEPSLVADDVPPVPPGLENTSYAYSWYSFSCKSDSILELAKTLYIDLDGFATYEPSIADPFPVKLWTRMIDFDGTPMSDWVEIADYDNQLEVDFPQVAWSGRYFAVCYNNPFDTFKMIAMNEYGEPIAPPIGLFWTIPPVEGSFFPCDIVAIDENTFLVALSVYTDPFQAYANGLWVTRVDVNIPIE